MAYQDPTPLAAPRCPGDTTEIRYVQEQARFYKAMRKQSQMFDLTYVLIPACSWCASADVAYVHRLDSVFCRDCDKRSTPDRAGRLAMR